MINIHNGDVIASRARELGLPGEHIAFREALAAGPVSTVPDHGARVAFLSSGYGEDMLRVSNALFEQEQRLEEIAGRREEVVLWFEHDLYCLVHLTYLIQRLRRSELSLIWSRDPLISKRPDALELLFDSRAALTPSQSQIAVRVWEAYSSPDPRGLMRLLEGEVDSIPFLASGLRLHARRFPSTVNGLGVAENRLLQLITAGASDFSTLFDRFDDAPRLGFGDSEILRILRRMATAANPLLTMITADGSPPRTSFALTPLGERVAAGQVDITSVNDIDEWLGGVHLTKENLWRWDEAGNAIIRSLSAAS